MTQPDPAHHADPHDYLTGYEIRLLRSMNGENIPDMRWGAAMSAAVEALTGMGFVTQTGGTYRINQKGRDALAALDAKKKDRSDDAA